MTLFMLFSNFSVIYSVHFQEVTFTMLDTATAGGNGHGLLHAVEHLLSNVFIPSLRKLEKGWGCLDVKEGQQTRKDFLHTLDSFVSVLVGK